MAASMTGFAAVDGTQAGYSWTWEIRGVNARGLDLRLRLPEHAQSLESDIRARASSQVKRGAIHIVLKVKSDSGAGRVAALNPDALTAALDALSQAKDALDDRGLAVAPIDPAAVLNMPGVTVDAEPVAFPTKAIVADFDAALSAFIAMREKEGTAMAQVIERQIDSFQELLDEAAAKVHARDQGVADRYKHQVSVLVSAAGQALDPERLSHDLAALMVKGDVSEEIDRLKAHIAAARSLIAEAGPVGRKLDFLMQEFNREANTLCSKSGDQELTRIGLDLKVVIDQMREQVQNLE